MPSRRDNQRGATALLMAIVLPVLLICAALAVDLGLQRVLRSDLQALADMVALDMSRDLRGKAVGAYTRAELSALDDTKTQSVRRNTATIGAAIPPEQVTWRFMRRAAGGTWQPAAAADVAGAIEVTAHGDVAFAFAGVTGVDRGAATRAAVAGSTKVACLQVSSYAAQLDTGESWLLDALLGKLLGSELRLAVLDPHAGLLGTDIALLDLIDELGPLVSTDISALSFTEVAGTSVSLSALMLATIHALERQSGRLAEVDLLRQVYGGLQANVRHLDVRLADLVELDTAGEAAADLRLDLLDLVGAGLTIANGTNVIDLPATVRLPLPLGAGGGGLVDLKARVTVGQAPVVQCSGKVASSQIVVELYGDALNLDLAGLVKVRAPVSLRLTLADASATVTDVACAAPGHRVAMLIDSGLLGVDLRIGQRADDPSSPKLTVSTLGIGLLGWEGIRLAEGTIALTSSTPPNRPTRTETVDVAEDGYSVTIPASTGGLGVPALHLSVNNLALLQGLGPISGLLNFLGISNLLQWVVNLVLESIVNPLVGTLDRWLLAPLLNTLGLDVAGGSVQVVPTVDCGTPRLVG